MQSKALTFDLYLKETPVNRLDALVTISDLCLKEIKSYNKTMRYGMPCYEKNDIIEVSFASQKNNITLYILKQDVMERYKGELKGASIGKGCIRFFKTMQNRL